MYVKELWRYPLKSASGERLEQVFVGGLGLAGDRLVHVERNGGHVVTARTHPKLLALKSTLGPNNQPYINGFRWDASEALVLIHAAAGPETKLVYCDGSGRFDRLPLLVATDGAMDSMGFDPRRFRPNILIGGVRGLAERNWPGRSIQIGQLTIRMQGLRSRCVMTTWHPDTQEQDITVLKRIVNELEGTMALDCSVLHPGTVRVGDPVALLDENTHNS